uniref:Uncharacterized protein n=1 Tax=Aegilops tauschii subsp. strangulata TaxID=200361 RepID=A0A453FDX0_AEGTS
FCIFMYIGWNFRIPEASLHLPVMPLMKSNWEITMPPIYSVEMDAADFRGLVSDQWHVGVVGNTAQLIQLFVHLCVMIAELLHLNLTPGDTAEDFSCRTVLFFTAVAGASSES